MAVLVGLFNVFILNKLEISPVSESSLFKFADDSSCFLTPGTKQTVRNNEVFVLSGYPESRV